MKATLTVNCDEPGLALIDPFEAELDMKCAAQYSFGRNCLINFVVLTISVKKREKGNEIGSHCGK